MKTVRFAFFCASLLLGAASHAQQAGVDMGGMAPSVRPQDDLDLAANGRWLRDAVIAPDQSSCGVDRVITDRTQARIRDLIEELVATPQVSNTNASKIADFYRSYMNEARIEALGLAPLAAELGQIDALQSRKDLPALLGALQPQAQLALALAVEQDARHSNRYQAIAYQSGLTLPDRDYYLKNDPRYLAARQSMLIYVGTLLGNAGDADASLHAEQILAFETRLARAQWSNVANRDPQKTYNIMRPAAMARLAPGIDWKQFFTAAGLPDLHSANIAQPGYAATLGKLLAQQPLATWRIWLRFKLLDAFAPELPRIYADAAFAFHRKALDGIQTERPRWKLAVEAANNSLSEAIGQLYVEKFFPPQSRQRMLVLVGNLLKVYDQSIDHLDWMSAKTRRKAHEKLAKYVVKIGYADKWRDYSGLDINPDELIGNLIRANRFEYTRQVLRLDKPVDRSEWGMSPQTVNAYYNPNMNEIVFPAAILQPPYFDADADDARNYGATGATIGHEISHGFDDQGSQFDGDGNLVNWWTPRDLAAFRARTARLISQFNAYEPLPGKHVNGALTLGENIADLSGLEIAYKAYLLSLDGQPAPVIDGYTGPQRFYIAYAQSWRSKSRDELVLQLLTADEHSPDRFRILGPVVNSDGFQEAFDVKPGDGMFKPAAQRIHIW